MSRSIEGVHGINIAVSDLDSATEHYSRLFDRPAVPIGPEGFAFPGLIGSRFDINGFIINLITSTDSGTSVDKYLARNGDGFFLLSLKVTDMAAADRHLRSIGVSPLLDTPSSGGYGTVNFTHPRDFNGIQIEFYSDATSTETRERTPLEDPV